MLLPLFDLLLDPFDRVDLGAGLDFFLGNGPGFRPAPQGLRIKIGNLSALRDVRRLLLAGDTLAIIEDRLPSQMISGLEGEMASVPGVSLWQHFADLVDPRDENACRHELLAIIGITIGAVIGGAESWLAVEASGRAKQAWLAQFFRLPHGIPSHDTVRRVFGLLDPEAFPRSFAAWIAALADAGVGEHRTISIDGTTVRRSGRRGMGLAPLHRVSAWAGANHVRLGQGAVDDQSNEITAIPRLLEWLDRSGARVTLDARGCPKEIAAPIGAGGGDSILAVKANQPHLYQDIQDCFPAALESDFAGVHPRGTRTEEINRGREEIRECHGIIQPSGLRDAAVWKGLTAIGMVFGRRVVEGVASEDVRDSIGSCGGTAEEDLGAIRGPWGIETSLPWVLDVVFREDASRHHAGNSGENLALMRKLGLAHR